MTDKCLTCRIAELIAQGTFLCVLAFVSFNVACDIQSIQRDVQCINEEVRDVVRRRMIEETRLEGEIIDSELSDSERALMNKISTTIKNDGPKDDNE